MIEFEVNVTGSTKKDGHFVSYIPKKIIKENALSSKKFLLAQFRKGSKSILDVVVLKEYRYKDDSRFSIYVPKKEAKSISIKLKDKITMKILDAKSEEDAKVPANLVSSKDRINFLELLPENICTHQTYRKLKNPAPLWFEYKDKYIVWYNSGARLHPLCLPNTLNVNPKIALLAGGLRGEIGSSNCVTVGEFANASPDFINFVLNQSEENLEINKDKWKGRIEYRGPKWDNAIEKKLKEFWTHTTGIQNFYKSRFTEVIGKKSIPCGHMMIHTGGILLKEVLNGLVNSIENRILKQPDLVPFYIAGLLSAEGSVQTRFNRLSGVTVYSKSSGLIDLYRSIFSIADLQTTKFKNGDFTVLQISGWNNFLKLHEITSLVGLTPFNFSLPYRDILFYQSLLNHCATKILLVWDESLNNHSIKLIDIKNKIEEKFEQKYSQLSICINMKNLLKNGFLEDESPSFEHKISLTKKGHFAKAMLNLKANVEKSQKRLKDFNYILDKFGLGKIEIDNNMKIKTTWFS